MSSASSPGAVHARRRSTPRVTAACRICKQRRTKCDGGRPKCASCQRNSLECGYEGVDLRKARHTTVEFKALTNRIAYLEEQVKNLTASQRGQGNLTLSIRSQLEPGLVGASTCDEPTLEQRLGVPTQPSPAPWTELEDLLQISGEYSYPQEMPEVSPWDALDSTDDWMDEDQSWLSWEQDKISNLLDCLSTSLAQLQIDEKSGRTLFVGPTSNLHLLNHDRKDQGAATPVHGSFTPPPEEAVALMAHEKYLMKTYRQKVHPVFPVCGNGILTDGSQVAMAHPLLLYATLGVASFFAGSDYTVQWGLSATDSLEFYTSQFTAAVGAELENPCLPNVKAFLLRAYLSVLQGNLGSATVFNSIACAMAKRLGLHVDCTAAAVEAFIPSSQDRNERLETFWAALWFDRRLALLEGRACQIDHIDISTPRPLCYFEAKENYAELPLSSELIYACHVEFCHLQDVTLTKIYMFSRTSTIEDATSDGHLKYISWFSSLPASVKSVSGTQSCDQSFLPFHMFFHLGLILLHRASLSSASRGAELANQRCRESAVTISSLLKSYQARFGGSPVDPMVIHAAFTASLVHLVLLLYPDIVTYRSSLRALRSTTRILSTFSETSPYAAAVLVDLQQLATKWSISPANSPKFWDFGHPESPPGRADTEL